MKRILLHSTQQDRADSSWEERDSVSATLLSPHLPSPPPCLPMPSTHLATCPLFYISFSYLTFHLQFAIFLHVTFQSWCGDDNDDNDDDNNNCPAEWPKEQSQKRWRFGGSSKKGSKKSPFRKILFRRCSFLRPEAEFQRGPPTDTVLYSKDFQEQKSKDYEQIKSNHDIKKRHCYQVKTTP